jgi:hypothetical protein
MSPTERGKRGALGTSRTEQFPQINMVFQEERSVGSGSGWTEKNWVRGREEARLAVKSTAAAHNLVGFPEHSEISASQTRATGDRVTRTDNQSDTQDDPQPELNHIVRIPLTTLLF